MPIYESKLVNLKTGKWMNFDVYNIILILYFIIVLVGIIKGWGENRSVIIYKNYDDLGLTFLVPASFIIINMIFMYFNANPQISIIISLIVAIGLFFKLIINTYENNNKNIGMTILALLTKIPLSIIWILNFMQVLNPSGKGSERSKNRGKALVILAFLTPIIGMLVVDKSGSYFNPKSWIAGRRVGSSVRDHL